jgi:site-specific DNA-methyltransferase (cytosine-N4-specific)
MRQWFELAGLVGRGKWEVDPSVLKHLLGQIDSVELEAFAQLTPEQKAFALAFARLNVDVAQSNKVASYASALYGVEFPEGGLPQSTLFALQDVGLITCEKTTSGQGAKPYLVRPTEKLKNEFLEPIFQAIEKSAGIQYRKLIRMPLSEILVGLENPSKHEKGLALEALAFYVSRLIGLQFVKWRLRSAETGGAELDVIMESANLLFSRWQIQCKNSAHATLDDIAKEVGLAAIIKSNVIMIVTTGAIGKKAKDFAAEVMRETNHQVILLQKSHLKRLKVDPTEISDMLRSQSEDAMLLKRSQLNIVDQPPRMKIPESVETTAAAFRVQTRAEAETRQGVQDGFDLDM